ncbi:unnamed protein product [Orchesella dallaii]|uniref:RecQ mediated genome instability protein 1 OB-fold domain-containing protein n=1 Tax=Orchesella dallaii TaxID=48710 RepID=A0ABP1RS82_9HEXA
MMMERILHEDLNTLQNDVTRFLKECIGKRKEVPPESLLQIQQVTNISLPTYEKSSYNDSSDKCTLKVVLTDGHNQAFALIPDSLPGVSVKTPPGTKLRLTQTVPVVQGKLLILTRANSEVLGGKVANLIEKWEVQKKMAIKHEWGYAGVSSSAIDEGPPAWKPFGHKSLSSANLKAIRMMKTTDVVTAGDKKEGASEAEKSKFEVQRDEAIQEGAAAVSKSKTFQKPKKHLLPKEIADIMGHGFSQVQAEFAMKRFKNFHKALKFLKEMRDRQEGKEIVKKPFEMETKFHRKKGKKGLDDEEDEYEYHQDVPAEFKRPTSNVSLFGFIEGQIKTGDDKKLPKTFEGSVKKEPEPDLEVKMEQLTLRGYRSETSRDKPYQKEMRARGRRGRGGAGGGGRGWRRGGGDAVGRLDPPSAQWDGNKDRNSRHYHPPPRYQYIGERGRGHRRDSRGAQLSNFNPGHGQAERHHRMPSSRQDPPRIQNVAPVNDPVTHAPSFFPSAKDPRIFTAHSSIDSSIFSAPSGKNALNLSAPSTTEFKDVKAPSANDSRMFSTLSGSGVDPRILSARSVSSGYSFRHLPPPGFEFQAPAVHLSQQQSPSSSNFSRYSPFQQPSSQQPRPHLPYDEYSHFHHINNGNRAPQWNQELEFKYRTSASTTSNLVGHNTIQTPTKYKAEHSAPPQYPFEFGIDNSMQSLGLQSDEGRINDNLTNIGPLTYFVANSHQS